MPVVKRTIKLRQANAAGQEFIKVTDKPGTRWVGCTSRLPTRQGVRFITFHYNTINYAIPVFPGLNNSLAGALLAISGLPTQSLERSTTTRTGHGGSVDPSKFQPRPRVPNPFNKPCPMSNFKELTHEEVMRIYHAAQAGRSTNPGIPTEAE
jgi:hypothetical protein